MLFLKMQKAGAKVRKISQNRRRESSFSYNLFYGKMMKIIGVSSKKKLYFCELCKIVQK